MDLNKHKQYTLAIEYVELLPECFKQHSRITTAQMK